MYMFASSQSMDMPLRLSDNLTFLYTQKLLIMFLLDFNLVLCITSLLWSYLGILLYQAISREQRNEFEEKKIPCES